MPRPHSLGKPGVIYGLKDPITKEIRYIGMTIKTINIRLSQHINHAKNKSGTNPDKNEWILNLLQMGLRPEVEILAEGKLWELITKEIEFIEKYGSNGGNLLNKLHNQPVKPCWKDNPRNFRNFNNRFNDFPRKDILFS